MKTTLVLIVAAFLAAAEPLTVPASRPAAPGFQLPATQGKPIVLNDYRGKVVLLNFWATTCGGCKVEMPWFADFSHLYQQRGLAVLGVATDDEGAKLVLPFLTAHPAGYPILIGNDEVIQRYKLSALPMTVLIDRQGRVAETHIGIVNRADFETKLRALLAE